MGSSISKLDENATLVYGVCGVACVLLVVLLVYILVNRNKKSWGCNMVTLPGTPLPDDITTQEHHQTASSDPYTIVVHHSNNCGFCKKFRPIAVQAGKQSGARVVFSEVDSSPENRQAFQSLEGVNGVPAYTTGGTQVLGIGYQDLDSCVKLFSQHVSKNS